MEKHDLVIHILDSLHEPIVFVDTTHIIQYMNAQAKKHYAKWGDILGKSIFHCHNKESCQIIKASYAKLENGEEEVLYTDNEKHRIYMRSVRLADGTLLGYYERYAKRAASAVNKS